MDNLADELRLDGLDGLVIDAECYDPDVLAGAAKTLLKVRYLLFEATLGVDKHTKMGCNGKTPSGRARLSNLVQSMDKQGSTHSQASDLSHP